MISLSAREMDERLAAEKADGIKQGLEMAAQRIEQYNRHLRGSDDPANQPIIELQSFLAESIRGMKEQVK